MDTKKFMAYENETDSFIIDNLTIENRLDRISLYGSLDITRDHRGLEYALKLKSIIDASIDTLQRDEQLPEHIDTVKADIVTNPF